MGGQFTAAATTVPTSMWTLPARSSAAKLVSSKTSTQSEVAETVVVTWVLRHPSGRRAHLPMSLEIHWGEGFTAVIEPRTGIHGLGATDAQAIEDFWQALRDFDAALENPLAPNLRQLRRVLDLFLAA